MIYDDTVIIIPTKREPPLNTLANYTSSKYPIILVCDPDVYRAHDRFTYADNIRVEKGEHGIAAQIAVCYAIAASLGYRWWFRLDDDLAPKTFIHKNGEYPSLAYVIGQARQCADETETTLAGFMNGSNRHWMGEGFGRTYGLIHGGAHVVRSTKHPEKYIDTNLRRFEDVYRSCAHRDERGAVGRVKFIGFDKSKSTGAVVNQTSIVATKKQIEASKQIVLARWPDFVTCNGTRLIHNGKVRIPNWRMRRHPGYTP